MRNLIILILAGTLWCGCSGSLDPERSDISLKASVGEISVKSNAKADPFEGTPNANNKLPVNLWFSYTPGKYSHNPDESTCLPCATSAVYENSNRHDIKLPNGSILQYPIPDNNDAKKVYCVGFSPQDGWGAPANFTEVTSAQHTINGSEDLMFAEQMEGSYKDNFPVQEFKHLLTWVKINLSATSIGAAGVWGEIEELKITTPNNIVEIVFPNTAPANGTKSTISYEGEEEELQLELLPSDKSLNNTSKTFGQVFCAPPIETGEGNYGYKISVKTKNIGTKEIFVELKQEDGKTGLGSSDFAIGKTFVINLRFNEVAIIEGECTLRHWDDQNSDIYLQPEQ